MDGTSVIKSVVKAANQYGSNASQDNLMFLLSQLDTLIGITSQGKSLKFFCPKEMLVTECLSYLLEFLNEPSTPPELTSKTMVLLFNLGADSEISHALQVTYNLPATLAACLQFYSKEQSPKQPEYLMLQCLQLLQKITYNYRISYPNNYGEDLIRFLIQQILGLESELQLPSLGLLANLCRNNISMQAHIKALDNIKAIYKKLIQCLSHSSQTVVVFSLSLLSSLCLYEEIGEKLFNAKNINQTFQLIFNILVKSDGIITRRYAVDLVIDVIKSPHIKQSLIIYEHFPVCLQQILKLLTTLEADAVSKIFELLLAFSSVNELRPAICRSLMMTPNLEALDSSVEPARLASTEPYFAAINWAMQDVQLHEHAPLKALEFLTDVYEELLDSSMTHVSPHLDIIIPIATGQLLCPVETDGVVLRARCRKLSKVLQLCLVLCGEEGVRSEIVRLLDTSVCLSILEHQLNHNRIGLNLYKPNNDDADWSEPGAEVVLLMMDLFLKLEAYSLQQPLQQLLQDQRLMPFFAHSLTCKNRSRVQTALRVITHASSLQQFPTIILGECIASCNNHKAEEIETLKRPLNSPDHTFSLSRNNKLNDSSIQGLIDKMKTGMDLRDVRASEIMDVYEHKLTSLATKESHLQDLLEAKALALAQADRLIAQYRCRRAQSEAEARKLRCVLKESEKRSEEYREQLQQVMSDREHLSSKLQKASSENQRLITIAEAHDKLVVTHADTSKRLTCVESTLATQTAEYQSLKENHNLLTKHTDELQTKYNVTVETLEKQQEELTTRLKETEGQLANVSTQLKQKIEQLEKEKEELDTALDGLRSQLEKSEKTIKELGQKTSTLESDCRKLKKEVREKDNQVKLQRAELDKHSQLTQMIHSLTGGK
ncbi:protein CIP2A-like isoform X2 [Amphiura filiformis]|uniref:protein CIP2A-like isoform X2 n=1 Tax=Amphiura filiformis TaxID=82378 RepID=UPI003B213D9C